MVEQHRGQYDWNRVTKGVVWKQGLDQVRLCSILEVFWLVL